MNLYLLLLFMVALISINYNVDFFSKYNKIIQFTNKFCFTLLLKFSKNLSHRIKKHFQINKFNMDSTFKLLILILMDLIIYQLLVNDLFLNFIFILIPNHSTYLILNLNTNQNF